MVAVLSEAKCRRLTSMVQCIKWWMYSLKQSVDGWCQWSKILSDGCPLWNRADGWHQWSKTLSGGCPLWDRVSTVDANGPRHLVVDILFEAEFRRLMTIIQDIEWWISFWKCRRLMPMFQDIKWWMSSLKQSVDGWFQWFNTLSGGYPLWNRVSTVDANSPRH